jgi:exodeoxyribonuclease V alpha subunit
VDSYESKLTPDVAAYAKYLVKFIGGIGQVKANDIAEAFGEDMFKIIQEQPERLTEIKGISAKIAQDVHEQVEKKKATQDIDLFFIRLGVTSKIQQNALLDKYGDKTVKTLSENPYLLTELHGIGFLRADQSALAIGISPKSYYRLSEGLIYTLSQGSALNGHTCMPKAELIDSAVDQLNVERELVAEALERCINEGRLVNDEGMIYNPKTLDKENNIARQMRYHLLSQTNVFHEDDVNKAIAMVEEQTNTTLDPSQREAVARSLLNNVSIITGGPGTGKTTTLNVLIKSLELLNKGIIAPIFLAAPTGLAAKRMSAQTGKRATTIHVMLGEIAPTNQQDRKIQTEFLADKAREKQRIKESERFARSTIVIDEMSMVDTDLMNKLVNQANSNARFIFVGDVDQLPSIGAGNVLKDMIDSKIIPVSRLTKVHRQAEQSSIIMNGFKT